MLKYAGGRFAVEIIIDFEVGDDDDDWSVFCR